MKNILQYRAAIIDVDGTLYNQALLRTIMAARLFFHFLSHPNHLIDLKIIREFRSVREKLAEVPDLATHQYQVVSDKLMVETDQVKSVIEKWIYRVPLPYLRFCRDERLLAIIRVIRSHGVTTIAYSDYPVADKLFALGLELDFAFTATDAAINCLKPNPRGLTAILEQLSLSPRDCILIGDRDEKDGLCARKVGMDFVILPPSTKDRRQLYSSLPFDSIDRPRPGTKP